LKLPAIAAKPSSRFSLRPPGLGKLRSRKSSQRSSTSHKNQRRACSRRKGDLTAILTSLELREVFLPRRNHRLQPAVKKSDPRWGSRYLSSQAGARISVHLNIHAHRRTLAPVIIPLRAPRHTSSPRFYEPGISSSSSRPRILSFEMDEGGRGIAAAAVDTAYRQPLAAVHAIRRSPRRAITRGVAQESYPCSV